MKKVKNELNGIDPIHIELNHNINTLPSKLKQAMKEILETEYKQDGERRVRINNPLKFLALLGKYTNRAKMKYENIEKDIVDSRLRIICMEEQSNNSTNFSQSNIDCNSYPFDPNEPSPESVKIKMIIFTSM